VTVRDPDDATLADSEVEPGLPLPADAPLTRGQAVGRYVILQMLGAGGMGVVYSAYDPDLDRKVALKLLRPAPGSRRSETDGRARLLREAQAMAKLSHPNVVAVHDVGLHDEQVFIAMEFVKGTTLGTRKRSAPGPWAETVDIYAKAGQGLAAAHAAGLIHRDFKPDNVLLGEHGEVKVTDFGLAHHRDPQERPAEKTHPSSPLSELSQSGMESLTRTGAVVGTPAYMAPEQHLSLGTEERSDQFSFCVALYEALYGERPFAGSNRETLTFAVTSGEVQPAPAGSKVPGWLRQVLLQGMRASPEDRWPDMGTVLAELRKDPTAKRRRWGFGLGGAGALIAAGVALTLPGASSQLCVGASERVGEVWGDAQRAQLEAAIFDTGVGFSGSTWARVSGGLDAYTLAWATQRTEACEATQVRGEQSQMLMDLRMECLDERLGAVAALVDVLGEADETVVQNAVEAVAGLPALDRCAEAEALRSRHPPPEDPAAAEAVARLESDLARAAAQGRAGKYADGLETASQVAEAAASLDYPPLLARALHRQGLLQHATGAHDDAQAALEKAFFVSIRNDLDETASISASELTTLLGQTLADEQLGRSWHAHAAAFADASGNEVLDAKATHALGDVALKASHFDEARDSFTRSMEIRERLHGPDHESVPASLNQLGTVASDTGDYEQAIKHFRRGLQLAEERLGADHPDLGRFRNNLAKIWFMQGKYEDARAEFQRALELQERALGPKHRNVAQLHNNLAAIAYSTGDLAEAKRRFELALGIWKEALGPEHPTVADGLNNLAAMYSAAKEHEKSRDLNEEALAIRQKTMDPEHPALAQNYNNLGEDMLNLGEPAKALELHQKALTLWEKKLGPDHDDVALALTSVGSDLIVLGRPGDAIPHLERAYASRKNAEIDPVERAMTQWLYALALQRSNGDRKLATKLDGTSRQTFVDAGEVGTERLEWLLEQHPR
jgi:tetratricopeptide (TPR) repeat protein